MANRYRGAGISHAKRKRIIERFDGRCAICGSRPPKLTMDHIVPVSRGGTNAEGNLQPACPRCNTKKGDAMPLGMSPAITATTDASGAVLG
jgi:5-methylcytosine-specific restriction endonuclease McrA